MKKITQAERVKLDGFYLTEKATSDELKILALKKILGPVVRYISDLKQLERLFIARFIQHV